MSSTITMGVVAAVGVGVDVYNSVKSNQVATAAANSARNIQQKQNYYDSQLRQLIEDPSSFFKSPIFTSALKIGQQATEAQMSASGFNRSSNIMAALQDHAMGFGLNALTTQENILAGLSGARQSVSDANSVASGAQERSAQSLNNVIGGLGGMIGGLTGGATGGGGASTYDASSLNVIGNNPFF